MFGISWWIWSGLALAVAGLYAVVYPKPNAGMTLTAWQLWVLRWGHTVVWLLLATSFVLRAVAPQATQIADGVAFVALPLYGLFLFTRMTGRK